MLTHCKHPKSAVFLFHNQTPIFALKKGMFSLNEGNWFVVCMTGVDLSAQEF